MDELSKALVQALHHSESLLEKLELARRTLEAKHDPVSWIAYRKICEHVEYVRKLAFDLAIVEGE